MGFHICEYCGWEPKVKPRFSHSSSGDVTLVFDSERVWRMPDMILHYVADHNWQPPSEFVEDVMDHKLDDRQRHQSIAWEKMHSIAYLTGPFTQGTVPNGFVERLEQLMDQAASEGMRVQTRGG